MPYKINETRRHKIPKAKYQVTNWPEYDAAWSGGEPDGPDDRRRHRGMACARDRETRRAGAYFDLAIETGLALRTSASCPSKADVRLPSGIPTYIGTK